MGVLIGNVMDRGLGAGTDQRNVSGKRPVDRMSGGDGFVAIHHLGLAKKALIPVFDTFPQTGNPTKQRFTAVLSLQPFLLVNFSQVFTQRL